MYKTPQKRSYSDSSFISAKETVLKVEITCSSSSTGLVAPAGLPAYLPARFWPRFGMAWFQTVPLSWWKVGSLGCGSDFRPLSDSLHCCCSSGATRALWPLGVPATSLLTLGAAGWFLGAQCSVYSLVRLFGSALAVPLSRPRGRCVAACPACLSTVVIFPETGSLTPWDWLLRLWVKAPLVSERLVFCPRPSLCFSCLRSRLVPLRSPGSFPRGGIWESAPGAQVCSLSQGWAPLRSFWGTQPCRNAHFLRALDFTLLFP